MGTIINTKDGRTARNFVLRSKEAFSEKIPRNTVKDIDISECVRVEDYTEAVRIAVTGSVETTSPTGKTKTYRYQASVDVNGKEASFASLEVTPLEG